MKNKNIKTSFKDNITQFFKTYSFSNINHSYLKRMSKINNNLSNHENNFPRFTHSFDCTSCSLCVTVCPEEALDLKKSYSFSFDNILTKGEKPQELLLDESKCIKCRICVEICPTDALTLSDPLISSSEDGVVDLVSLLQGKNLTS